MEESDGERLRRYRRGEVEALQALVEKYRRPLYGFILNMTQGAEGAEDVFQEVWFKAIRRLPLYRQGNFFGWLVRIAHNAIIDRARRRRPDVSLDDAPAEGEASIGDAVASRDPDPAGRVQAADLGRRLAKAVAALPMEQKEVFVMRVRAGLSFREIAEVQRVSVNTALARMQYALGKLRPMLKEDYEQWRR